MSLTEGTIYNTKGKNEEEVEKPLAEFLHYASESRGENLAEACDERVRRLHEIVESIRSNSEMEASYMKGITREREMIADAKAEGFEEGKAEGIAEGRIEGKVEGIAEGKAEGRIEGIEIGIIAFVSALKDMNVPAQTILEKLQEKFGLSMEAAKKYI